MPRGRGRRGGALRFVALAAVLAAVAAVGSALGSACFAANPPARRPQRAPPAGRRAAQQDGAGEAADPPPAHGGGGPKRAPESPPEPSLFPLWEQWGLLGLVVGLLVAFGAFDGFVPDLDAYLPDVELAKQELAGAVTAATAGVTGLTNTLGTNTAEVLPGVSEAASEVNEAMAEGGEVALLDDLGLSVVSQRIGFAGGLGTAGGLAGLLADTANEPTRKRKGPGYISISEMTPGTTHASGQQSENAAEDRPLPALQLGVQNFTRELRRLVRAARLGGALPRRHVPSFVPELVLSNEAVMERERARPEVPTPFPVRVAYDVLCWFIDVVFEDRPIPRFWFLETVARMPYFAYLSVLHLYETLGWWRSPELRAVHAAEEDNELHHLLIMESLGGDQRWLDRFFAQHAAILYYWILVLFFIVDPRWSYNFSRLIEAHAVDTYGEFADANKERLRSIPPPPVAVEYYLSGEWYLFDKFQTALQQEGKVRRPPCSTLYDVFRNICDDEEQHVLTMEACEEWVAGAPPAVELGFNRLSDEEMAEKVSSTPEGRAAWASWGEEVQRAARDAAKRSA